MNAILSQLLLNFIIAVGEALLANELPLVKVVGGAMIDLGEQALAALLDGSTPQAQKELEWKQQKDVLLAAAAKAEDQLPSIASTVITALEQLAFSQLLAV